MFLSGFFPVSLRSDARAIHEWLTADEEFVTSSFPELFMDQLPIYYDIIIFAGDEILDWNEISLVDCTDEEVQDIIAMDDSCDLHLVISRDR